MKMTDTSALSDGELVERLPRLAGTEREATVTLVVHLCEFDSRRLYEGLGFGSLWDYCIKVLHLSEDAAANRIQTARMARRFPAVLEMLATGTLTPTTARLLAAKVTDENHDDLFRAAAGKTRREVEELLAHRFPLPEVRSSVRKMPSPTPPSAPSLATAPIMSPGSADPGSGSEAVVPMSTAHVSTPPPRLPPSSPPPAPAPIVGRPLGPDRYEVRYTATAEMYETLRFAQDLLAHAIPSGDIAQVIHRGVTAMIEDLVRKKFALTGRPRGSRGQADDSPNIPADVKRAVYLRDRGSCAYVSGDGRRCGSRRFVQFHHVHARAAGGKPTVENVELRCRAHNLYEAEVFFGFAKRYRRDSTRPGTGVTVPREPAFDISRSP